MIYNYNKIYASFNKVVSATPQLKRSLNDRVIIWVQTDGWVMSHKENVGQNHNKDVQ
jgi:hypothetical protein